MVSSCISVTGVGNLVRIDEIMNAETCMHAHMYTCGYILWSKVCHWGIYGEVTSKSLLVSK